MVCRRHCETDKFPGMEHGHAEADIGAVGSPVIRIIVNDHVAFAQDVAARLQLFHYPLDITWDGAGLQRRTLLAFAELPALRVTQRRAEVLGFADDAGVGHAHEFVSHFYGDVFQGAVDDTGGHGVYPCCA